MNFLKKAIWPFLFVAILVLAWDNPRVTNLAHTLQVRGWLMAGPNNQLAGEKSWSTAGTKDTLLITGIDTLTVVQITPKVSKAYLKYQCEDDTVFVTSDSSETTATKYSYLIVRNGYGATD